MHDNPEEEWVTETHQNKVMRLSLCLVLTPLTLYTPTALDAPKDLTVAEVTETSMLLRWKHPLAKLDSYRLVYVSAEGHRTEEVLPAGSESYTMKSLTPGMLYTISISAERGHRTSVPVTASAPTGQLKSKLCDYFNLNKEEFKMLFTDKGKL